MRLLLFHFLLLLACAAHAQDKPSWTDEEKAFMRINKTIANRVTGMYSNRDQADTATSRLYASQDIRSFALWEDRWEGKLPEVWYYFGWFATGVPDNPLTEYIAKMTPISEDSILVNWYRIPNASQYKREWERTEPFKGIDPDMLQDRPSSCRCYLIQTGKQEAHMTSIVPCPFTSATASKFKYLYFDVILKGNMNVAKNKYYDKDFNVVFEFKNPSEFKLITRNKEQFTEEE